MVPIYDSDVAEERWAKAEWNQYELWEKVELRLRRNKRVWIAAAIAVFLAVSSVPIVVAQKPKWIALSVARQLAQEINRLKREASIQHAAFRIRFNSDGRLQYVIERADSCQAAQVAEVRTGTLVEEAQSSAYLLLDSVTGDASGVPGLVNSFCYDPISGSDSFARGQTMVGFGILPANDLTERRFERLSVLLLSGPSAEISFE